VQAIPQIIPPLVGAIPQIISSLVGAIVGAVPQLLSAGVDLMRGFINGITSMAGNVINAVKNAITDRLPGFVKKALGIHSPSRVFAQLGRFTGMGFEEGLTSSLEDAGAAAQSTITSQMKGIAATASGSLSNVNLAADMAANADRNTAAAGLRDVTINVSLDELEDLVRLGEFAQNLRRKVRQTGGVR